MSDPPFFQSAGRGDLLFLGGKEGPTVVICESLSEQGKESWLEKASTMQNWVVWWKSKKVAEDFLSFEMSGKEIFFNNHETKSKEQKEQKEREQKKCTSRAERTIQVMVEIKAKSKWQSVRITLHAGFTKISLSQENKFRLC